MKRVLTMLALFSLALCTLAWSQEKQDKKAEEGMKHAPVAQTAEWQQLKSLVGNWQGTVNEGGKEMPATVEVRMTGGGSALMHWMAKDTPYEMVTMFHPDGPGKLLATHYCAAHNQPRMEMVKAPAPNQIAFRFKDGTNIGPGDGHMVGLVITFIDANHHDEAWSYEDGGKELPASVMHFTRKQ
ncbi:MAG TPA: hypothetical protein VMU24_07640 [Candidatus Acidoferrales bacterium]|nr:hypothetical protein [Candidatus Acidoferrales bacterium]